MRRNLYTYAAIITALFTINTVANAQDTAQTNHLNEVIVTASKFAQKQGETGKVITVLTRDYLEKNSGKSLTAILNNQAGLMINGAESPLGNNQEVYLRGGVTGNTLILIDGIPVNDASQIANSFDLNFINPELIDRIEILRGSQSTLYGSDAVAGVINIITRKPGEKKAGIYANGSYGTFNTYQGSAALNGTINKFSYILGYKYQKSDGFSTANDSLGKNDFDKDGFKQNNVFAKLAFQATDRWKVQYMLNLSDYKTDLDAGAFTDDKAYNAHNKYIQNAISSKLDFGKGSWNIVYSYQRNQRNLSKDSSYIPVGPFPTKYVDGEYVSNTHQIETFVNWDVTREIQLLAGADYRTSSTDQHYSYIGTYPGAAMETTRLGKDSAHSNQFSHYASLLLHNLGGFNLELGGRFNYHNIYGNNQTISFNPSYLINDQHKFFINLSSAYKVPSLYQLYSEFGNRLLKPESSVNYEGGYQASVLKDRLNFRVVGFKRDTRDLIVFFTEPVTYKSYYINNDKQTAYGAELEATWNITDQVKLQANYTYTDGKISLQDTSYYNLYRMPKHAVNAALGYQATPALYLSTQFKYLTKRWEPGNTRSLDPYYTIDIYGEYKVCKGVKVFADFRNITDQEYFTIRGYNNRKFNFTAGISCNF